LPRTVENGLRAYSFDSDPDFDFDSFLFPTREEMGVDMGQLMKSTAARDFPGK